jgi:uncharacterized protein
MATTEVSQHPIERARTALEERPVLAADLALSALGATRGHRSAEETQEYLDLMARALIAASRCPVPAGDEDPLKVMLGDRKCDRLACAALLRLLVFDDDVFSEDRRLLGAPSVFDRVLAKTLYPEAGLSTKDQSFLKRDRLRTLVADHESALIEHVRSLQSMEGMKAFRPAFGKLFNSKANRSVVLPFLPEGVTTQTFDELLAAAQSIFDASDASMIAEADEVSTRCRELAEKGDGLGTWYAEVLISGFTETLERLVRQHVSDAGFSDPAELALELRPKRFPFGQTGSPVMVRLDLANKGPGQAQEVSVEIEGGGVIAYETTSRTIGLMGPGKRVVEFHGTVAHSGPEHGAPTADELMTRLRWRDADGGEREEEDILTLEGQDVELPWERLVLSEPYSLSPVTEPEDFAGQQTAIRDLTKVVLQMGNARIQGEKRVGKTSLANAVRAPITELSERELTFIALESGDFNANTPEATVARLGELVSEHVRKSDERLHHLPTPDFENGLSTLTELFVAAAEIAPNRGLVVVLDEFDAMPHAALYRHEPLGDALFQTLRSLGGKPNVCFVLIGGERMKWVIAVHGQALNKFKLVPLDYFGADQREDYAQLVREPVEGTLVFSDAAIERLHEETAGNPWISKLLLTELFERQVQRRDADVQADDVADTIEEALPKIGAESFQHFWDDAIRGDAEEQEHVSTMRRRVLLALGLCLESRSDAGEEAVVRAAREFSVDEPSAREIIRDLLDRSILRTDEHGLLRCRVPLFERWLPKHGPREIVLGSGDDDSLITRQRAIDALRPGHEELSEIARRWKSYKGEDIRPEQIASWLEQFGGPQEQRAVMPILQRLRFYTRARIDAHLNDLHQYLQRELARRGYEYTLSGKQRLRNDLLVCALEGGGSGASQLVKPYREENGIYHDCAVDPGRVREILDQRRGEIRAVIVLEDMIGTGGTASGRIRDLHAEWTEKEGWPEGVDVFLLAVCGYEKGLARVERGAAKLDWPLTIRVADALGEEERCFSEHSGFFDDESQRERAKALCAEVGNRLSPKDPFGFGDSQAAICFEYRCPNNSLPVLWKNGGQWQPLFPRL